MSAKRKSAALIKTESESSHRADDELWNSVYHQLRRVAVNCLKKGGPGSLQPTVLIHETFLRLEGGTKVQWESQEHFYKVAATVMRYIRVDYVRTKLSKKRGGNLIRVEIGEQEIASSSSDSDLLAVDGALEILKTEHPNLAELVELKFFAGFTLEEVAKIQNISLATAKRHWSAAKLWLRNELGK